MTKISTSVSVLTLRGPQTRNPEEAEEEMCSQFDYDGNATSANILGDLSLVKLACSVV